MYVSRIVIKAGMGRTLCSYLVEGSLSKFFVLFCFCYELVINQGFCSVKCEDASLTLTVLKANVRSTLLNVFVVCTI